MLSGRYAHERDVRVDFFRGLALMFIFVDHIPGNFLAFVTLHRFGFSDAAEVFVGLAGYAAFLAYYPTLETAGWRTVLTKVALRIRDLYLAHIAVLVVCVAFLCLLAHTRENPLYLKHANMAPFVEAPTEAFLRALMLLYQPGYLDILPLYIVLLVWFPLLLWLIRQHIGWAFVVSAGLWMTAAFGEWKFPSYYSQQAGWVFNPLAWQFLFSLGAMAAYLVRKEALTFSRAVFWVAASYLFFAFLVAAPWTSLPGLAEARLLPADLISPMSKRNLSLWRLAHIAALAYVAATLIPHAARWLARSWAVLIIKCGSHSLPVFCVGIILSNAAFVAMVEFGQGAMSQLAINIFGLAILSFTGWRFAELKRDRITSRWLRAQGVRLLVLRQRYRDRPVATKPLRRA